MVEHADEQLRNPGGKLRAQELQPAVPVQDSNEASQLAGHLVHQVKPDRPEQTVMFIGNIVSVKNLRKRRELPVADLIQLD